MFARAGTTPAPGWEPSLLRRTSSGSAAAPSAKSDASLNRGGSLGGWASAAREGLRLGPSGWGPPEGGATEGVGVWTEGEEARGTRKEAWPALSCCLEGPVRGRVAWRNKYIWLFGVTIAMIDGVK